LQGTQAWKQDFIYFVLTFFNFLTLFFPPFFGAPHTTTRHLNFFPFQFLFRPSSSRRPVLLFIITYLLGVSPSTFPPLPLLLAAWGSRPFSNSISVFWALRNPGPWATAHVMVLSQSSLRFFPGFLMTFFLPFIPVFHVALLPFPSRFSFFPAFPSPLVDCFHNPPELPVYRHTGGRRFFLTPPPPPFRTLFQGPPFTFFPTPYVFDWTASLGLLVFPVPFLP